MGYLTFHSIDEPKAFHRSTETLLALHALLFGPMGGQMIHHLAHDVLYYFAVSLCCNNLGLLHFAFVETKRFFS